MYSVLQTSLDSKSTQQHVQVHFKAICARDSGQLRPSSLCFEFCHIITTLKAPYLNLICCLCYEDSRCQNLLSELNMAIKLRRLRWVVHLAQVGVTKCVWNLNWKKTKGKGNIGYISLNLILFSNINIYTTEFDFEALSANIWLRIG